MTILLSSLPKQVDGQTGNYGMVGDVVFWQLVWQENGGNMRIIFVGAKHSAAQSRVTVRT